MKFIYLEQEARLSLEILDLITSLLKEDFTLQSCRYQKFISIIITSREADLLFMFLVMVVMVKPVNKIGYVIVRP